MLRMKGLGSGLVRGWRGPSIRLGSLIAALLICVSAALSNARGGAALQRITRDELRVTNGAVTGLPNGALEIQTPSSRAVVRSAPNSTAAQSAEIHFRYLGPSKADKPLASGELRRQIGLKLRAADSCNVVYVMWHIAPDSGIAVSVKRNAAHSHVQCGVHGYEAIAPLMKYAPRPIEEGDVRMLRAELRGRTLGITADGQMVWLGTLPRALPAGPPGFRTDNARFVLEYFAGKS